MCDQCVAKTEKICEPITGWKLVVAHDYNIDGRMGPGDYGLISPNDQDVEIVIPREVMPTEPHVTWEEFNSRPDLEDMSDIELEKDHRLIEQVVNFAHEIKMKADSLSSIADLVIASVADGFDNEAELFCWWLSARLGKAMQENM